MSGPSKDLSRMSANLKGQVCQPRLGNPSLPDPLSGDDLKAIRAKRKAQREARKRSH